MTTVAVATRITFTRHAVERYQERVRPAATRFEAVRDLARIASSGQLTPNAPSWLNPRVTDVAPLYLQIADLAFPLKAADPKGGRWSAVTCVTRGFISEAERERRNRVRRARSRGARRT